MPCRFVDRQLLQMFAKGLDLLEQIQTASCQLHPPNGKETLTFPDPDICVTKGLIRYQYFMKVTETSFVLNASNSLHVSGNTFFKVEPSLFAFTLSGSFPKRRQEKSVGHHKSRFGHNHPFKNFPKSNRVRPWHGYRTAKGFNFFSCKDSGYWKHKSKVLSEPGKIESEGKDIVARFVAVFPKLCSFQTCDRSYSHP